MHSRSANCFAYQPQIAFLLKTTKDDDISDDEHHDERLCPQFASRGIL
jgi:hypothetical protein